MKIALITPPYNPENMYPEFMVKKKLSNLLGKEGLVPGVVTPLGLLYIAAVLRENDHEPVIIDGAFNDVKMIIKKIKKESPDLIGISSTTPQWEIVKKTVKNIKEESPDLPLVVGGPHPTNTKEECLKDCKEIDVAVIGEGEYTILDICNNLEKNKMNKVKGIVYRENNKIFSNTPREPIWNLNELPFPARNLIDMKKYCASIGFYKKIPNTLMITSRGCPYNCIFCSSDKNLRMRSVDNVIAEVEELILKFGIKDIHFYDENITLNKKRLIKICDEIIKRKFDIVWSANARADTIDKELLKKMKKAGCWQILYGIESGVQKNIDTLKKGLNLIKVKKAIKLTHKVGIETFGSFIFGIPGETFDEVLKTIKFACELNLDYAKFSKLTPFPGTELYNNFKKYGRMKEFSKMDMHSTSFIPYSMSERDLDILFKLAYKKFYMRTSYVLQRFFSMRSFYDFKRNVLGFLAFSFGE